MFGTTRILGIAGGVALACALAWGVSWKWDAQKWQGKVDALTALVVPLMVEVRLASDPSLSIKDAPEQVRLIASSRKAWKDLSATQSAQFDVMALESARLKSLNADLRKTAQAAIVKRDTAIRRLEREALSPGERADCARQLFDAEAALDLVYREGL